MKINVTTPEVLEDAIEVVEAAQKVKLITPKRIAIAVGVTAVTVGAVLLVKKIRAAKAEKDLEDNA